MQSLQVAKTQLQEAKRDCFIIAIQTFLLHQLQISCLHFAGLKSFTHSSAFFSRAQIVRKDSSVPLSYCLTHISEFSIICSLKITRVRYIYTRCQLIRNTHVRFICAVAHGSASAIGRWCKQNHSLRHIPLLIQREWCNSPRVCMCARRELDVYQPSSYYCPCYYIEGGGARRKKGSERFGSENEFIVCGRARCATQSLRNKRVSPASQASKPWCALIQRFLYFHLITSLTDDSRKKFQCSHHTLIPQLICGCLLLCYLFVYVFSVSAYGSLFW